MLFVLPLKLKLKEKAFSCVKTKTNSNFTINLAEILKEATIHFCLFDESHYLYSLICENGMYKT